MFMGGLGGHELVYWSKHGLSDLLRQREEGKTVYKLDFPLGRKNSDTPFYSLIGGDCIRYLHRYLDVERPKTLKRYGIQSNEIFLNIQGNPIKTNAIRTYWVNHLDKLGTITRSPVGQRPVYERGLHQLRSLFRTAWHKTPADNEVAEGLMGHSIDKNKYNQIMPDVPWVTREYRKALRWLNIMSSNTPFGLITEDEVEQRSDEYKSLRADMDKLLEDREKEKKL